MRTSRTASEVPPLPVAFHAAYESLRADYHAGSTGRFRPQLSGVSATGSGADFHYRSETHYLRMMERSRYYDRNDMIVGQGINRLCTNIFQEGFTLDVNTGDAGELDNELRARFWEWALDEDQCDFEGEKTFEEMAFLALRHVLVDGDDVILPLEEGSLQFIEGHRIRTPSSTKRNVVCGVLLDEASAKRREYWVTKEDIDPLRPVNTVSQIKPYRVRDDDGQRILYHLYDPKRFSQRRGVTCLAPCIDAIGMHGDVQFATLVKAQVASCFAIFEELSPDYEGAPIPSKPNDPDGPQRTEIQTDGTVTTVGGIYPGMRVRGRPGVKMQGFAPNIPNPEFFPHAHLLLTFIAVNLDLPIHVLLLDPSKTNFSGWRGAIDQARLKFRKIQQWLVQKFYSRVYRFKLRQWIGQDPALRSLFKKHGNAIFGHEWHPPAWRYLEPLKDSQAETNTLRGCQNSRRRVMADRAMDWGDVSTEICADNILLIEKAHVAAVAFNKKYPDAKNVTWERVLQPISDALTGKTEEEPEPAAESEQEPVKRKTAAEGVTEVNRINGHSFAEAAL